jgi:hypothetical protein
MPGEPWEWAEQDLLALVTNQVQESLTMEYKACAALAKTDPSKNEVSKDVSSLANSAGGTIVYGLIEKGHIPQQLDLGFDPAGPLTREWLEQVVLSRIQPRPDGLRIKSVDLAKTSPGRVAYVVYVPQAVRAHMAADHRYYKRFEYQAVPMNDYEVRDVNSRTEGPRLAVILPGVEVRGEAPDRRIALNFGIANQAATPAEHAIVTLYVDRRLGVRSSGGALPAPRGTVGDVVLVGFQFNWSVPGRLPIWQGVPLTLCDPAFEIALPPDDDYQIFWKADSPRMPTATGRFALTVVNQAVSVEDTSTSPA